MSLFSSLFKTSKTPTYSGPKPYKSLLDATGGQEYYKNITDRVAGRGVGFGGDYAEKYANPIIQNSRNTFQNYTLPELKSDLTLTGRRAASSGSGALEAAYRNQTAGENDVFSRLQQRNEDQQRNEINNALESLGAFNKGDYDAQNIYSNFDRDTFNTSMKNKQYDESTNSDKAGRIVGAGAQLLFGSNPLVSNGYQSPYGGGVSTGQDIYSGGNRYPVTQPPYGYNYNYSKPTPSPFERIKKALIGRAA